MGLNSACLDLNVESNPIQLYELKKSVNIYDIRYSKFCNKCVTRCSLLGSWKCIVGYTLKGLGSLPVQPYLLNTQSRLERDLITCRTVFAICLSNLSQVCITHTFVWQK